MEAKIIGVVGMAFGALYFLFPAIPIHFQIWTQRVIAGATWEPSARTYLRMRLLGAVFLILGAYAFFFFAPGETPLIPRGELPTTPRVQAPPAGAITIQGIMLCLPHRNTSGPQTLECAFGLKDDQGRYYGLRDSDPEYRNISSISMNVRSEVHGIFTPREDTRYQSIGVIEIIDIRSIPQ